MKSKLNIQQKSTQSKHNEEREHDVSKKVKMKIKKL